MPGSVRKDVDSAGGTLIQGSDNVIINNHSAVRVGDQVNGHGDDKHASPTMATGSGSVFVNNISVCRAGDVATCGHAASGSDDVIIN